MNQLQVVDKTKYGVVVPEVVVVVNNVALYNCLMVACKILYKKNHELIDVYGNATNPAALKLYRAERYLQAQADELISE